MTNNKRQNNKKLIAIEEQQSKQKSDQTTMARWEKQQISTMIITKNSYSESNKLVANTVTNNLSSSNKLTPHNKLLFLNMNSTAHPSIRLCQAWWHLQQRRWGPVCQLDCTRPQSFSSDIHWFKDLSRGNSNTFPSLLQSWLFSIWTCR